MDFVVSELFATLNVYEQKRNKDSVEHNQMVFRQIGEKENLDEEYSTDIHFQDRISSVYHHTMPVLSPYINQIYIKKLN